MGQGNSIRVVIADDHSLIREGIRRILEQSPQIMVVGEAGNGLEAIQIVEAIRPDVLILDLQMPGMDGLEVLRHVHKKKTDIIILILTALGNDYMTEALAMGAWGYYLKEEAPTVLFLAIQQAVEETRRKSPLHFNTPSAL